MTAYQDPPRERPVLVWALTGVVVVGLVVALVGMILNAWLVLGVAAAVTALAVLALWPAGVMSHVGTTRSTGDRRHDHDRTDHDRTGGDRTDGDRDRRLAAGARDRLPR